MSAICPYCRMEVEPGENEMVCTGCGTPHHRDCYEENGGCTVFGCTQAPVEEPKVSVTSNEAQNAIAGATYMLFPAAATTAAADTTAPAPAVAIPAPSAPPQTVAPPPPPNAAQPQAPTQQEQQPRDLTFTFGGFFPPAPEPAPNAQPPASPAATPPQGAYPPGYPYAGQAGYVPPQYMYVPQPKNRTVFALLGVFLGALGIHNFYAGFNGKAIAQLLITILTCGYGGIISWVWAVVEICTVNQDSQGVPFN